jgi:electron transfer flavoprotein alpha subunit
MSKEIWVILEHNNGKVKQASLEAVAAAKAQATNCNATVCGLLLGKAVKDLAPQAAKWGADKVVVVEDDNLDKFNAHPYADVIASMAKDNEPVAIIAAATPNGKDVAPRIAVKLNSGLLADCIAITAASDGTFTGTRSVYSGKLQQTSNFTEPRNQVVTIRPKVIAVEASAAAGEITVSDKKPQAESLKTIVKEIVARISERPELTQADIIVAGGRGVKSLEGFKIIEDLADTLGAAVGASRSAVDAGYREHTDQVGQTGKVVNPKLYIACGISGAIQHLVGMSNAKYIVAINKDADAPIFQKADYGIVGDIFDVVPLLNEELKKVLA